MIKPAQFGEKKRFDMGQDCWDNTVHINVENSVCVYTQEQNPEAFTCSTVGAACDQFKQNKNQNNHVVQNVYKCKRLNNNLCVKILKIVDLRMKRSA